MNIQEYQENRIKKLEAIIRRLEGSVKYWHGRTEFLDEPIEQSFWQQLKGIAAKKNIKTMREFLQKVPFDKIGTIKILDGQKKGTGKILNGMATRAFINWLIYYQCYNVVDPSYIPVIKIIQKDYEGYKKMTAALKKMLRGK
jgi:hypothetical protein